VSSCPCPAARSGFSAAVNHPSTAVTDAMGCELESKAQNGESNAGDDLWGKPGFAHVVNNGG
jgi:hypothetical protein